MGALLSYLMHAECHTSPEDSEVGAVWSALLSTREISGHGDSRSERTLRDRRSCRVRGWCWGDSWRLQSVAVWAKRRDNEATIPSR